MRPAFRIAQEQARALAHRKLRQGSSHVHSCTIVRFNGLERLSRARMFALQMLLMSLVIQKHPPADTHQPGRIAARRISPIELPATLPCAYEGLLRQIVRRTRMAA